MTLSAETDSVYLPLTSGDGSDSTRHTQEPGLVDASSSSQRRCVGGAEALSFPTSLMRAVVLHAWDGLCGAVSTELEDLLITSPNASVIYAPPLGVNREMAMYQNYRYADDDPSCWPQPYMNT